MTSIRYLSRAVKILTATRFSDAKGD